MSKQFVGIDTTSFDSFLNYKGDTKDTFSQLSPGTLLTKKSNMEKWPEKEKRQEGCPGSYVAALPCPEILLTVSASVLEYFQWLRTHCLRREQLNLLERSRWLCSFYFSFCKKKKNYIMRLFSFEIRINIGYHWNFMFELKFIFYDIYQFVPVLLL